MYVCAAGVARLEDRTLINRLVSMPFHSATLASILTLRVMCRSLRPAGRDARGGGEGRERGAVPPEQASALTFSYAGLGAVLRQGRSASEMSNPSATYHWPHELLSL